MQCDPLQSCRTHTNAGGRKHLLLMNTARVTLGNFFFFLNTVHGTQGPKMALHQPLVET